MGQVVTVIPPIVIAGNDMVTTVYRDNPIVTDVGIPRFHVRSDRNDLVPAWLVEIVQTRRIARTASSKGESEMPTFRLLLLTGCVLALGNTARAAEPQPGQSSNVPVFILGGDADNAGEPGGIPKDKPALRVRSAGAECHVPSWSRRTASPAGRFRTVPREDATTLPQPIADPDANAAGTLRVSARDTWTSAKGTSTTIRRFSRHPRFAFHDAYDLIL